MELLQHPFFHDLERQQAETLAGRCVIRELPAGAVIFSEGDPSEEMCLVLRGTVAFSKGIADGKQRTVSHCPAGTFFGEVGIFTDARRALTATALESVTLGCIHRDQLVDFIRSTPGPIEQILGSIVRHLHDTTRHYMEDILQQEKLSLVGTMMNSIIHDFRTPFTVISLGAQMLLKRFPDEPKVQKLCRNMEDQIRRMNGMFTELAEFSRGSTTALQTSWIDLRAFFEGFRESCEPLFQNPKVVVTLTCEEGLGLEADAGKLHRVLQNLIGNAVEAYGESRSGVVRVHATREQPLSGPPPGRSGNLGTASTAEPPTPPEVHLTISDDAGGIPEAIQATLFEPFVTHGKAKGTGLGTAIAKSMIEAHGGTITFQSTLGVGTTFHLRLPQMRPDK